MMNRPHFDDADDADDTGTSIEIASPSPQALSLQMRAEIDMQIATAHAFPRSIATFARQARELVTLSEEQAQSCIYSLPRGKGRDAKTITGPSARFAEVIQYCFKNSRGGGRVVGVEGNFVVAQGVFHDLENNIMVTMEVRRRITDKYGKLYNDDMVMVTGNAAAAIAHRNAVLKAIPKAVWQPVYDLARFTAVGDVKTLDQRRSACLSWFANVGVTVDMVLAKLELGGIEDITLDVLEYLTGIRTAIKDGSVTPERAFGPEPTSAPAAATGAQNAAGLASDIVANVKKPAAEKKAAAPPKDPAPTDAGPGGELSPLQLLVARMKEAATIAALDEVCEGVAELPEKEDRVEAMRVYRDQHAVLEARFGEL